MEGVPQIITEFTTDLVSVRGSSPKTAVNYTRDLMQFLRYLKAVRTGAESLITAPSEEFEQLDVSGCDLAFITAVKQSDILSFLFYTQNVRGNSAKSRARKLSSIKSFYKYYCIRRHDIEHNPTVELEGPRIKKPLPKYMSLAESEELLNAVADDEKSKTRRRDYCMITLLLNCGMRLAELCGINLRDIDRELRSLRVVGKGAKERIIYLNDACREALGDYMTERMMNAGVRKGDRDALFISRVGRRISRPMVQVIVGKYLEAAGLGNRGISVHKLRHTAATLMYSNGVDVRVLKEILGHEQLNTTQIYTHVSDTQMENAMSKNPLGSLAKRRGKKKNAEAPKPCDDDVRDGNEGEKNE